MSKPSQRSPERKLQVVLSVLRSEVSVAEAARRAGVAEQTVHNWLFGNERALGPRWWGWEPPESGLTYTNSE